MKILYCGLRGGFGNQLFQAAQALALSHRYGAEFVVDDGWYLGRRQSFEMPREFGLDSLMLSYRLPNRYERSMLYFIDAGLKIQKRARLRLLPIHFDELPLSDSRLRRANRVFMHGSWQVFGAIVSLKSQLDGVFRFRRGTFGPAHSRCIAEISADSASVAVHVRRGDYVRNPRTAALHTACSLEYYFQALSLVRHRLHNPSIYLFSDDLEWARQNLPLTGMRVTVVDASKHESPERVHLAEFDLMRRCRHAVIANSSFSWWVAFLLQTPQSLIIAPKQWYAWGSPSELYSPDWVLL